VIILRGKGHDTDIGLSDYINHELNSYIQTLDMWVPWKLARVWQQLLSAAAVVIVAAALGSLTTLSC